MNYFLGYPDDSFLLFQFYRLVSELKKTIEIGLCFFPQLRVLEDQKKSSKQKED